MLVIRTLSNHKRVSFYQLQTWISMRFGLNAGYGTSKFTSNVNKRFKGTQQIITNAENTVPIMKTITAMVAGVVTVSSLTSFVEYMTSFNIPPYSPSGTRFDLSTYMGRFCDMLLNCDPSLLLHNRVDVRRYREMMENHNSLITNPPSQKSIQEIYRDLWEAKRIVASNGNEDKIESIPRPFRMSGYVPFNGPICVAMVASTSTPFLLFWSWVNQSQNALVNYYNRAEGSEMTTKTLRNSYIIAVSSALTVAFGFATWIKRRYNHAKASQLMKYVAFPSAVVASSINCYIIRSPEIELGIPLFDEHGKDVLPGTTSQVAARKGVYATTASRALLQAPVFIFPSLLLSCVPAFKKIMNRQPTMTVPLMTYMVMVAFGLGLPAAVSIFPHICEIGAEEVEMSFRELRNDGVPYKNFYFNKGL